MTVEALSQGQGRTTTAEQRAHQVEQLDELVQAFSAIATPQLRQVLELAGAALGSGITPTELLARLAAPQAPEPSATEPAGARCLPLSIAAFFQSGTTLEVFLPAEQVTVWIGDAAVPPYLRNDEGSVVRGFGVWSEAALGEWFDQAGIPEDARTVGRLLSEWKGVVRSVRTP